MTKEEKAEIKASFAGKRISEMIAIERKVFDEDFPFGFGVQTAKQHYSPEPKAGQTQVIVRSDCSEENTFAKQLDIVSSQIPETSNMKIIVNES